MDVFVAAPQCLALSFCAARLLANNLEVFNWQCLSRSVCHRHYDAAIKAAALYMHKFGAQSETAIQR